MQWNVHCTAFSVPVSVSVFFHFRVFHLPRKNVPSEVVAMKTYVDKLPRGSGYYFRAKKAQVTYCVWHDTKTVTLASTAYPAHSENTVVRRVKDPVTKSSVTTDIPCPVLLEMYNKSMGGVDKSDQYISYHKVLRKTVKYWKTTFYHLVDIAVVNAHILYNWFQLQDSEKTLGENQFRDALILKIISMYGTSVRPQVSTSRRIRSFKVQHGSKLFPVGEKGRCVYCHLHNIRNFTQRKYPDCPLVPAFCQTLERDCHSSWHSVSFSTIRKLWYEHRDKSSSKPKEAGSSSRGRGRPKGSVNRRKRRGNYRSK